MKATELRIGNRLHSWKFKVDIELTLSDFYEACAYADGAGESEWFDVFLRPIPLTEEWMKEFGGEDVTGKGGIDKEYIFKHNFGLIEDNYNGNPGLFTYGNTKLEYVHQLQNLYFALTGEELTITK